MYVLGIRYKLFEKFMKVVNRDLHRDTSLIIKLITVLQLWIPIYMGN